MLHTGYRVMREEGPVALFHLGALEFRRRVATRTCPIGTGRECPLCAFTGRRFAPTGPRLRADAACPECESRERHRLLWTYLDRETDLADGGQTVLYIAPTGRIVERLRSMGNRVITADLAMDSPDVRGDLTRLPVATGSVDTVLCIHVLEHIPDDCAAIQELYRVLVPGGDALVMVPKDTNRETTYEDETITSPSAREAAYGTRDHVRLYGLDIVDRLEAPGFDVEVVTYAKELPSQEVERFGLRVDEQFLTREFEDIHHCTKPTAVERYEEIGASQPARPL